MRNTRDTKLLFELSEAGCRVYGLPACDVPERSLFVNRIVLEPVLGWLVLAIVAVSSSVAEPVQNNWAAMEDAKISVSFRVQRPVGKALEGTSKLVFSNKYALSAIYDAAGRYGENWDDFVLFDLEKLAWFDVGPRHWVDLKTCQEWEKASIERSKASLAKAPNDEARAFAEAMVNPRLQLQKVADGSFTIFNSHVTYSIVPASNVAPHLVDRFNSYDQLNAYHKAMSERQLPPTTQIAVDKYLAQQKIFPKQMTVKIKTAQGNVIATTDARVDAFDATDAELLRKQIAQSQ